MVKASITATGKYLPEKVVTNLDLECQLDTSDKWIVERTGIKERRYLDDTGKATAFMCAESAKQVLKKRNIDAKEIDLIIVATITPDMFFPSTACLVQDMIGADDAWGFDLGAACSGFLYALVVGTSHIQGGLCKKVLVLGGDKMTSILNMEDRSTAVIFGDGAGGVLLENTEEKGFTVLENALYSDGSAGKKALYMPAGGSLMPASIQTVTEKKHTIFQDGPIVFKSAILKMSEVVREVMNKSGLGVNDIDFLVSHQANYRIINATARKLGISMDKVVVNIHKYGNTTAGTIPIALTELVETGELKEGDNVVLVSFGAGYTWGASRLLWKGGVV